MPLYLLVVAVIIGWHYLNVRIAAAKGYNGLPYVIVGIFLTPLTATILTLLLPSKREDEQSS